VTVEVEDPFAVIDAGEAEMVVVGADSAPGVKDTVGFVFPLMLVPPIVPDTVAEPVVVLFSVAEYVPLLLSVTALSVPRVLDSTTVAPPDVSAFPFASFAVTVTAEVDDPSAVTDAGDAEIVVFGADAAPGVNETVGFAFPVMLVPPIVPDTVAEPVVVGLVNVAE
jgi:hypothetical protein